MPSGAPEVAGYRDLQPIGRGGHATVYRARQVAFDRAVAVKVLDVRPTDGDALKLFARECRTVGALSGHPHVIAVHDAGTTTAGHPYLAMELIESGSLQDRMARGPVPAADALRWGAELADAVDAAHAAGILHRDIKPANLMIDGRGRARLADFGIARLQAGSTSTSLSGTPAYMAPEVLAGGRASEASDVYGTGMTVTAALLGVNPFQREGEDSPFAVIRRVEHDEVPRLTMPGVPPAVAELLQSCVAKDPAARPPSAGEVRDVLRAAQVAPPVPAADDGSGLAGGAATTVRVDAPAGPGASDVSTGPDSGPWPSPAGSPVPAGRPGAVVGVVLATLLVVALVAALWAFLGGDDGGSDDARASAGSTASSAPSSPSPSSSAPSSGAGATTTAAVAPPSDVVVQVLNGSGTSGVASEGQRTLETAGWTVLEPENGTTIPASTVYAPDDLRDEALAVAAGLGLEGVTIQGREESPDASEADIVVLLGRDVTR